MRTTRWILVGATALAAATSAWSQAVDFLLVSKQQLFTQTDNTTATLTANPWRFRASVEGAENQSLSGITAPTIALPSGSTGSSTMTYDAGDNSWIVQNVYSSASLLNAAYANGNYSLTAHGQTVTPISLTGDTFPPAPVATLSGGTIVNGILSWNPSQALTLTISGTGIDHMGLYVSGMDYDDGVEGFGVGSLTFTVPAFTMTPGVTYFVEMGFDDIVGGTNPFVYSSGTGDMLGAEYAGVYGMQTKFEIQAIPEPSTYAVIVGGLALGGAMVHRRRRAKLA